MDTTKNNFFSKFFKMESSAGILLFFSACLALVFVNSPLKPYYDLLLSTPVSIQIGDLIVAKPFLLWINDGLMAVFFFLVGLELKREWVEGELSDRSNVILPAVGAIGGMAVPALVYAYFNWNDSVAMKGWAIPAATDIAFALGILAVIGSRVPLALKVFLTSLAIMDDIGAIVIIAFFYTANMSLTSLIIAAICIPILFLFNKLKIESRSMYLLVGLVMWTATLKSGVHATLAGVVLAMFIPMKSVQHPDRSPLKMLEHDLHSVVSYFILPVFAFANAGISFAGMGIDQFTHNVTLGVALGLILGKQVGVFGLCYIAVKSGIAKLPASLNWKMIYGASALCGVGFTMSLFIGSLAFEETGVDMFFDERLGIILGSFVSGIIGFLILNKCLPYKE